MIIRTAPCSVDDVVNLKLLCDKAAGLARIVVTQKDRSTDAPPWATASTGSPAVSTFRCSRQGEGPAFRRAHAWFDVR